jgi:formyl-CoA transferase
MPALERMRVLELSQYEAGPTCGQLLAWLGADVVKLEPPGGEAGRHVLGDGSYDSQYLLNYNANKRGIVLDLDQPRGRELLLALLPRFDVVVENYAPGVMERLGLSYETLCEENPRIVLARIKGYGLSGPYAGYKSYDPLAQAAGGIFSLTGEPDGPPLRSGGTFADTGTGMMAALAVTAAYVQQQQSGRGQQIELSMQEVVTMFVRTVGVLDGTWPDGVAGRRGRGAGAPSDMFACAPGGPNDYVYTLVGTSRMWDALCTAMERLDLLADARFDTAEARRTNREELHAEIEGWTRERTKHEVMRILGEAGVPCSAVLDTRDLFRDPHLLARGFVHKVQQPTEDGTIEERTLLGSPLRLSASEVPITRAPRLGEHTAKVLAEELGLDEFAIEELRAQGVIA